ncbi:MAG: 4-hydroxy-3-methylbut-2-enyl diphosphate reductase, partial [bacterium]|nr:4-hydroxy-3-methylbut-2-enyl diphosphate reductase [bacterium]
MISVKRANKYGFCSGVRVADLKVRRFAEAGNTGSILGQVVHNERVVEDMERLGMRTVDTIDQVDSGTIVFSAHGVPPSFHDQARDRRLNILDTTCKFVYDIHRESREALKDSCHLVFIGHPEHREVAGYTHDLDPTRYHVVAEEEDVEAIDWSVFPRIKVFYQTTLNANDFEHLVSQIEAQNPNTTRADTICYATKENQDAARDLAADPEVDIVIVVGGAKSANTRHLWEITTRRKRSHLIQGARDLQSAWFANAQCVGLTAGASTPDSLMDEVEGAIVAMGRDVRSEEVKGEG